MATAFQPPHIVAQEQKQADLARKMNSADPVERWKAKETAFAGNMAQMSKAMVQQAKENARAMEQREREIQRFEQEYYVNKYNKEM